MSEHKESVQGLVRALAWKHGLDWKIIQALESLCTTVSFLEFRKVLNLSDELFGFGPSKRVVVELDGHEFHERTKEQAQKDKSRDRALAAEGWTVLRFTGSEIWAAPQKCAREGIGIFGDVPEEKSCL